MMFHIKDGEEYIAVDFDLGLSSGWHLNKRDILDVHPSDCKSWKAKRIPPIDRVRHLTEVNRYEILSIDDTPFAEWKLLHSEYFI